jgi:hypothetical protein
MSPHGKPTLQLLSPSKRAGWYDFPAVGASSVRARNIDSISVFRIDIFSR